MGRGTRFLVGFLLEKKRDENHLIVDDETSGEIRLRRALEAKYRIAEAESAEAGARALPREQPIWCC